MTVLGRNVFAAEAENSQIYYEQYRQGAISGTLVGFGTGHTIQGRPAEGQKFLYGELASLAVIPAAYLVGGDDDTPTCTSGEAYSNPDKCPRRDPLWKKVLPVSVAVFIGFKIWESVDLWNYDYKKQESPDANKPNAKFFISPISKDQVGGVFVLNF